MAEVERQFAVELGGLAAASVLTGAWVRTKGRFRRRRSATLHTRADGTLIEVETALPTTARRVVLLDSGLGMPHEFWDWVCAALPADTGYLRFNRPGYGLSTPTRAYGVRHHFALLDELREEYLGELPVVLAGHSLGGYLVAAYAGVHKGAVRNVERVVMVDSTNVRQLQETRGGENDLWYRQILLTEQLYTLAGLSVFIPALNRMNTFRPEVNCSGRAVLAGRRIWATAYREYMAAMRYPLPEPFGVPLDVVIAQDNVGSNSDHLAVQREFIDLSEDAAEHVVEGSTHESLLFYRDHARKVACVLGRPTASAVDKVDGSAEQAERGELVEESA